jgi:hypothetical protein
MFYDTLVPGHEYTILSLPPIWAWALLFGGKDIENRGLCTERRGRVLVHASGEGMSLRESQERRAELSFLSGIARSALPTVFPRNAILGSVEIVDCVEDARSKWAVPGKQHWVLRDPRTLEVPVELLSGDVQLFRWVNEVEARVHACEQDAEASAQSEEAPARAGSRRAPSRSGIVPAVRLPNASSERAARPAATQRRSPRGA